MFELKFFLGGRVLSTPAPRTCDKGNLLPTIATMMQEFEATHGVYDHQRNYAVQWKRVRQ